MQRAQESLAGPRTYIPNMDTFPMFKPEDLTAETIGRLAEDGDRQANDLLAETAKILGWAIAQVITLNAPEIVIVGGGVFADSRITIFESTSRTDCDVCFPRTFKFLQT